jgi:hypothetical protein
MANNGPQSSSPSYVLLASLDAARALASEPGAGLAGALAAAAALKAGLRCLRPHVRLLGEGEGAGSQQPIDPLRFTVRTTQHWPGSSSRCAKPAVVVQVAETNSQSTRVCEVTPGCKDSGITSRAVACAYLRAQKSTRVAVQVCVTGLGAGVTGYDVAEHLERRFHVVPELATPKVNCLSRVGGQGSQGCDSREAQSPVRVQVVQRSQPIHPIPALLLGWQTLWRIGIVLPQKRVPASPVLYACLLFAETA